ncbi:shikimate kinase [Streptomyces sp. NPDC005813]|uniref:shikimate kinase n=1 Tax=Streptomyces sp. NPDC005813 TaxID=3155592 RepID=UPI0033EB242F
MVKSTMGFAFVVLVDRSGMQPQQYEEVTGAAGLVARLRHVYWIGGGSGAGKSTTARRLADRYGWRFYATDDVMHDHAGRTTSEDAPYLHRFIDMSMDERWVNRSPEVMLETFHWFRGEGFGLIIEDLLRLPQETCVIVEGFRLLPHLVKPLLAAPEHAVWLLPTPDFRRAAILSRSAPEDGFLWRTSDPAQAGRNIAERDRMFTQRLRDETERLQLRTVQVDITMSEDDLAEQVTTAFRL